MQNLTKLDAIPILGQTGRIIVFLLNTTIAWLFFYFSTGELIPTGSGASVWLLAAIAFWLLRLVAAPYFAPPKESIGVGIAVILMLVPVDFSAVKSYQDAYSWLNIAAILIALLILSVGIVAASTRSIGSEPIAKISYELSKVTGKGEIAFTLPIIISVLAFYQSSLPWSAFLLGYWVIELSAHPIELLIRIGLYLFHRGDRRTARETIGELVRIDAPNIARFRLNPDYSKWQRSNVHVTCLPNGQNAYVIPLFLQLQNDDIVATGIYCPSKSVTSEFQLSAGTLCAAEEDGLLQQLVSELGGGSDGNDVVGFVCEVLR